MSLMELSFENTILKDKIILPIVTPDNSKQFVLSKQAGTNVLYKI